MSENEIRAKTEHLRNELEAFIAFFGQALDYEKMVYEFWSAKDILGHITFWHESFARNISDIGYGKKPNPLKGKLSEVNQRSVEETKTETIGSLIDRLRNAQKIIEKFICQQNIQWIPYKKGSRDYSRREHIEIVTNHIHKHLSDLIKVYAAAKK
ncbi:MAG: hypothetical protein KDC83_10940 [Flavobacteriales bacterium]|nr:hypothetical protein [Flavobacteriales bacterium]